MSAKGDPMQAVQLEIKFKIKGIPIKLTEFVIFYDGTETLVCEWDSHLAGLFL